MKTIGVRVHSLEEWNYVLSRIGNPRHLKDADYHKYGVNSCIAVSDSQKGTYGSNKVGFEDDVILSITEWETPMASIFN